MGMKLPYLQSENYSFVGFQNLQILPAIAENPFLSELHYRRPMENGFCRKTLAQVVDMIP
jgi:hypothetical protein